MARHRYVWVEGELYERGTEPRRPPKRSHLPAPMIQSDHVDEFRSHADGQIYSSKSRYREELRARGMVEVGNERAALNDQPTFEPIGVAEDISKAIDELST